MIRICDTKNHVIVSQIGFVNLFANGNNDNQNSVYSNQAYGPWFKVGGNLGLEKNNLWKSYCDQFPAYPKVGIPAKFDVEDYEVFQVIKK